MLPSGRQMEILRAYAADIGRVAFVSLCVIAAVTLGLEIMAPGVAGNVVSPQRLVAATLAAGFLAMLASPDEAVSARSRFAYAAAAALLTAMAFFTALRYFDSMTVALTAAFAAALPFLAYSRSRKE